MCVSTRLTVCVCVHQTVLKNQVADYTREKELTQQAQLDMMEEQRQQEVERKRLATKQVVAFRERVSECVYSVYCVWVYCVYCVYSVYCVCVLCVLCVCVYIVCTVCVCVYSVYCVCVYCVLCVWCVLCV